jgi:hypothetical protein
LFIVLPDFIVSVMNVGWIHLAQDMGHMWALVGTETYVSLWVATFRFELIFNDMNWIQLA